MKEPIRKYRKVVDRNGWMVQLYKWTTDNSEPNFKGYCPFFWTVAICVVLSPITLIGKLIEKLFNLIPESNSSKGMRNQKIDCIFSEDDAIRLYETVELYNINLSEIKHILSEINGVLKYICYYSDTLEWAKATPDWKEKCRLFIKTRNENRSRALRRKEVSDKIKIISGKIIDKISWLPKALGIIAIGFGVHWAFPYIYQFLITTNWGNVGRIGLYTLGIIFAAYLLSFVMRAIGRSISKGPAVSMNLKLPNWMNSAFTFICICVSTPFRIIWNAIVFIIEGITLLYKKECPLMELGDESKPIQKNK